MNENASLSAAFSEAQDHLTTLDRRQLKRLRQSVRKVLRRDLQRRAITGEPSPFKRAGGEA
ncbi:hypothetical protein D3C76_720710 [compost metagenome]